LVLGAPLVLGAASAGMSSCPPLDCKRSRLGRVSQTPNS
jgi:hypothetical protein